MTNFKLPFSELVVHCKREKFDVYIGRPSIWGNPFSHKPGTLARYKTETREESVSKYTEYLMTNYKLMEKLPLLKGKILGCYCSPNLCHGHVLAELANRTK